MRLRPFYLCACLAIGLAAPGVCPAAALCLLAVCPLMIVLRKPFRDFAVAGLGALLLLQCCFISRDACLSIPIDGGVEAIEGRLIADSDETDAGAMVMNLKLSRCYAGDGLSASASGVVRCIGGDAAVLESGAIVKATGRLETDGYGGVWFKARSFAVLGERTLSDIRRAWALEWVSIRLGDDEAGALMKMLLAGRSSGGGRRIKELARSSGCLHVLALSGLHLEFFSSLVSIASMISVRRRLMRVHGLVVCIAFVYFVGPRSSLLRAVLMMGIGCVFPDCALDLRLCIGAALQAALFPDSFCTLASVFSYLAMAGIAVFSDPLRKNLVVIMPAGIADVLSAGMGAMAGTVLISFGMEGKWHPLSILITPFAGFIVFSLMGMGIVRIAFPEWEVTRVIGSWACRALRVLFGHNVDGTATGLAVMAAFVLTVCLAIKYSLIRQRKGGPSYELGLQLRFSRGDKGAAAGARACDVQEVRAEFHD